MKNKKFQLPANTRKRGKKKRKGRKSISRKER